MCYAIFLSTTSPEDLSQLSAKHFQFRQVEQYHDPRIIKKLDFSNRWRIVGQYGGCSCHFRHSMSTDLEGFGPPEDWSPEDDEEVDATRAVYEVLKRLLDEGHKVDIMDFWAGSTPGRKLRKLDVSLAEVDQNSFRFFENYLFKLSK